MTLLDGPQMTLDALAAGRSVAMPPFGYTADTTSSSLTLNVRVQPTTPRSRSVAAQIVADGDADDAAADRDVRNLISRRWAEDWDSDEDSADDQI